MATQVAVARAAAASVVSLGVSMKDAQIERQEHGDEDGEGQPMPEGDFRIRDRLIISRVFRYRLVHWHPVAAPSQSLAKQALPKSRPGTCEYHQPTGDHHKRANDR